MINIFKLILFQLKTLFNEMAQRKVPTTAHLAKLEDLLCVVKGIEQEAYDITSVLPSKNNVVLNGKVVTLKQTEVTSATINNDKSIDSPSKSTAGAIVLILMSIPKVPTKAPVACRAALLVKCPSKN